MRRQWWLGANHAALALQAFEQRGFLTADVGAGADTNFDVESVGRAADLRPEIALGASDLQRAAEDLDRMRIFRADVDEAFGRADRDTGDGHTFDQHEGIALHDHAVGEGAGIALVGVADDVFLRRSGLRRGAPLDSGREPRSAAPAQARANDLFDGLGRTQG